MEENYTIPLKYRKIENLHIVFWLIKDLCWCIVFKPLAIVMIIPTIIIAATITWRTRKIATEFYHNIAVLFWIAANCLWMFGEFYGFSETVIIGTLTGKNLSIFPFLIGIGFLSYYYVKYRLLKNKDILKYFIWKKAVKRPIELSDPAFITQNNYSCIEVQENIFPSNT